jgi:hypothetical protein
LSGSKPQPVEPREKYEDDRKRKDEKDNRNHHSDLFAAAAFDQCPTLGLSRVRGLRDEHVSKWRATLDRYTNGIDKPPQFS